MTLSFCRTFRTLPEQTLKASGVPCITVEVGQFDDATAAVQKLFSSGERFTAVFVADDRFARPLYRAVAGKGIRIPEDLSVIGYGGLEWNDPLSPPLTTMRQDPEQMGREAARLILARLNEKEAPRVTRQVRLVPEIRIGGSTAAI